MVPGAHPKGVSVGGGGIQQQFFFKKRGQGVQPPTQSERDWYRNDSNE